MADKQISQLQEATSVGLADLFVLEQNSEAKKLTGQTLVTDLAQELDGHGGISSITLTATSGRQKTYTITYADTTTSTFVVMDGEQGIQGDQTYVHIRYSADQPTQDSDISSSPNNYIGIYTGTSSTAPTTYTSYAWFQYKGDTGDPSELTSNAVAYQGSANGSVIPAGTWEESPPVVTQGEYLWTRIILAFNNGSPVTYYTVSRQGVDGQGAPGTQTPLMNGVATVGSAFNYSREDHVHPTDTSRASTTDLTALQTAIANKVLQFTGVTCSVANNATFATITNAAITTNHILLGFTFANPVAIYGDFDWATTDGSFTLSGRCDIATTVDIILIKKDN